MRDKKADLTDKGFSRTTPTRIAGKGGDYIERHHRVHNDYAALAAGAYISGKFSGFKP